MSISSLNTLSLWRIAQSVKRQWIMAFFLWLLGLVIFMPRLGYPRAIVFDESYLIPNAQSYINGVFFQDSHPPLARLLIALGQVLVHPKDPSNQFVDVSKIEQAWPTDIDISGYRLFPALFGSIIPVLGFATVWVITSNEWIALLAALALLFDNALLTQSRFALPDSFLVAFCLMAILCFFWLQARPQVLERKDRIVWALWGLSASAAFMVKLTGLFVLIVVPFYLYKLWVDNHRGDIVKFLLTFGLAFSIVFVLIWEIHFSLLKTAPATFNEPISAEHAAIVIGSYSPNPIERFLIEVQDAYHYMFAFHKKVPALDLSKPDEIGSPWYYWPFDGRAMPYRWDFANGKIKIIYLIGNPVTWLISLLGVMGLSISVVADAFFRLLDNRQRLIFYPLFLLYWMYMLSVAMIPRVLYLYHYLPPMALGVIMFGVIFMEIKALSPKAKVGILLGLAVCILIAFQIYSPFIYYREIPIRHLEQLNVLPIWDLRCPGC